MKKLVYGVGINDSPIIISRYKTKEERALHILLLKSWGRMLERSSSARWKENYPHYSDTTVCSEWKYLSAYKDWALVNGFSKGLNLDKDILVRGNKEYGPEACCFVPGWVNGLIVVSVNAKRPGPLGVIYKKTPSHCRKPLSRPYMPFINTIDGKRNYGSGGFSNPMDAHREWQLGKAEWLELSIQKYMLEPSYNQKVANALYSRVEMLRDDADNGRETFSL